MFDRAIEPEPLKQIKDQIQPHERALFAALEQHLMQQPENIPKATC
jgi:hypothetical protein